jgi:hypothetical protein
MQYLVADDVMRSVDVVSFGDITQDLFDITANLVD